jgi:uroporphyrinogen-III synthase
MNQQDEAPPLIGRRIALMESREAERLGAMLREQGAETVGCPMIAIVDAADPAPVLAWLHRFISAPCDDLVLLTGEGLMRLHSLAQRSGIDAAFVAAVAATRTITRGPKPARALRVLGLKPDLRAEEPTTDGIIALLSGLALGGRRIGVQLYPNALNNPLIDFLSQAGAVPDAVTPYEYASHVADEAIIALIDRMAAGEIDAIAFTSAPQIRRLFDVALAKGRRERLLGGLGQTAVAAVGPVAAAALRNQGVGASIVPSGAYFMKPLVSAITAALTKNAAGKRDRCAPHADDA